MKAVIKIHSGSELILREIPFNTQLRLGRSEKSDCALEDPKVSSDHCHFFLQQDRLMLYDNKSKNGTYLNGIKIEVSEVFIGDRIKIGKTTISLDESKMDEKTVKILTFPGPFQDRISRELQADFTGARIQNQLNEKAESPVNKLIVTTHLKEIAIRKKASSQIRLSKDEIKYQHKMRSRLGMCIDFTLWIAFCYLAVITMPNVGSKIEFIKNNNVFSCFIACVVISSVWAIINSRVQFTLGETLAGIEGRYKNQSPA